ncbi:alcohol dehydrogenase-like 3 isoform X4 [Helianthus annuus]|uniref:alcohol dehydrogenase-like 3 isoform X4 n=2 Tax=Helianthus annuus TaxID=4232 RepID=UPI000B8F5C42|nr:alcohol dehydrogenase-like 3 isoform X4 [Helianthus annuus]
MFEIILLFVTKARWKPKRELIVILPMKLHAKLLWHGVLGSLSPYNKFVFNRLRNWRSESKSFSLQFAIQILMLGRAWVVESVGEGVDDIKEGDHILTIFNGECGECTYCKSKTTNLCAKFRVDPLQCVMRNDGKTRFLTQDGKPIYHFLNTSTFSEYTVMDSACVVKINPKAPLNTMTLLSCCLSTGMGSVINTANIHQGSTVAVFGLGAVGLAVILGAKTRGASTIIGIDINDDKRIKGQKLGMTNFINPNELKTSVHEKISEMTEGGVDFSFECAGNLDVLREAFLSTHDGWGLTVVLGIHPTPRMLPLHPMELFDGRTITGSVFGGCKGKTQLPLFVDQFMNMEDLKLEEFITHELPFNKIDQAFELLIHGKSLRCLLHF